MLLWITSIRKCPPCKTTPWLSSKVQYFVSTYPDSHKAIPDLKIKFYFHFNNIFTLPIAGFEYMSGEYEENHFWYCVQKICYIRTSRWKSDYASQEFHGIWCFLSNMQCTTQVFACTSTVLYSRPLPSTPRESSNLNTVTGYSDFGISVVVYWISRKTPGFTLIRPWPHPDTFLPARYTSILMLYLFRAKD